VEPVEARHKRFMERGRDRERGERALKNIAVRRVPEQVRLQYGPG
jgi:hypothetical protein